MIPLFRPSYDNRELEALREVLKSGWVGLGPKTAQFEHEFARYIGMKHAIGVNSCTAALHLALRVMEVENREVITPSLTFVSTNHAILYNSARPVFADIEEETLTIDPDDIQRRITPQTKAIMVVHYGGHSCRMDEILEIARQKNLKVIEDAAHGCGGEYKGGKLGSIGDIGCFSFHAVKNLAVGEGGMITTQDDKVAEALRRLRWLGISRSTWDRASGGRSYSWFYDVEEVGFKCHMHDISAAIGLVQLEKLESANLRRRQIVARYNEAFKNLSWLKIPQEKPYAKSAWHNYVLRVEDREGLIEHLVSRGIAAGVHYYPNHLYEIYSRFKTHLPVTEEVWKQLITLPLFPDMTEEDIKAVINGVKSFKILD